MGVKHNFSFFVYLLLIIFFHWESFGQIKWTKTQATQAFGKQLLPSVCTGFDYPSDKVIYGFWQYAKNFGIPNNQRSHYEVKILDGSGKQASYRILYGKAEKNKQTCDFCLAADTTGNTSSAELSELLLSFKKQFYLKELAKELDQNVAYAQKLSKKIEKEKKKGGSEEEIIWTKELIKTTNLIEQIKAKQSDIFLASFR